MKKVIKTLFLSAIFLFIVSRTLLAGELVLKVSTTVLPIAQ